MIYMLKLMTGVPNKPHPTRDLAYKPSKKTHRSLYAQPGGLL